MKRLLALLLSIMVVFMFTACSHSQPEPQQKEEPTEEPVVTSEVSGIVEELAEGELTIYTDANESVTFDIENAEIKTAERIQSGDKATVEYTGEISDGDTSDCEVTKVISAKGEQVTIEGKVKSNDTDKYVLNIKSDDNEYAFNYYDVKSEGAKIAKGDKVAIVYAGILSGTNTRHAYVKSLKVTKKAEKKVEVKAVDEKVWTTDKVNVRADSSKDSKKIASLEAGKKLKRTAILSNGWSRVTYKDKDRYIDSKYLTTKKPKTEASKDEESKLSKSEDKAAETKAEQPAMDDNKLATAEEQPAADEEQPAADEEAQPAADEEQPAADEEQPADDKEQPAAEGEEKTDKIEGVITAYDDKDKILTLKDKDDKEMLFEVKKAKFDFPLEDAIDQKIKVEYIEDNDDSKDAKHEAVKITLKDADKAETGSAFSGGSTMILIIAVIAIIAGIGIGLSRRRREDD